MAKGTAPLPEDTVLAERTGMLYAGTHVTSGRARAVAVATGPANEIGHIAKLASQAVQPETQLERRIRQFGRVLVGLAIAVFGLVLGIGLWRNVPFTEIFMVAISQMVSLVPEGLPVAVTIALAVGVQRMARRGTIVRRLSAVETLGSTTVICSDKTGILTRNEMTVTAVYLPGGRRIEVTGVGYDPGGAFRENGRDIDSASSDETLRRLLEAGALCNDSRLLPPDGTSSGWRILGDPTEGALLSLAAKGGLDPAEAARRSPRRAEIPFDSDAKMMATEHETPEGRLVFLKGAPDVLSDLYGGIFRNGAVEPLSEPDRVEIRQAAADLAAGALRVLALGFVRDCPVDAGRGFAPFAGRVVFLGLVGQLDPPREEAREAVGECRAAGIRPVMVTGDHKATAVAVAKSLGIAGEGDEAVEGRELERMTDSVLSERLPRIRVFARVHPAQKPRIVEAYQKQGEVVAMTGDGVNDAPALVRADVGVAMGVTGTEVAKEAAKIVITDDDFATIVKAVAEGRLVYQNIKKTILFLLSTSAAEVVILFLALVAGFPPPFTAVQILWNNLVTEGIITINLIMERLEGDEMYRPPHPSRRAPSHAGTPLPDGAHGAHHLRLRAGLVPLPHPPGNPLPARAIGDLPLLVVCEWFNVLNCRSETRTALNLSLLRNPWLLGGLILGNALHGAVIYWPPCNELFHTVPIAPAQFFEIGAVGSLVLWVEELRKWLLRRRLRESGPTAALPPESEARR